MATSKHDIDNNTTRLINVGESGMSYDPYMFRKIHSEMNRTRDALEQIQKTTKDSILSTKKRILSEMKNTQDS